MSLISGDYASSIRVADEDIHFSFQIMEGPNGYRAVGDFPGGGEPVFGGLPDNPELEHITEPIAPFQTEEFPTKKDAMGQARYAALVAYVARQHGVVAKAWWQ
jgi:hypothetical protein